MLDVPAETWYLWVGLAVVGTAALGLAVELPSATPDAARAAATVDSVAASAHDATARQPLDASEIRLSSYGIGLRGPAGAAHGQFAYGPVTPAGGSERLTAVLRGKPPAAVFDSRRAFERAIARAERRTASWRPAPDRLLVRRVTWGEANATLVGA